MATAMKLEQVTDDVDDDDRQIDITDSLFVGLRQGCICEWFCVNQLSGTAQEDACEELAQDGEEGDTLMVIAGEFVALLFPERGDHTQSTVIWESLGYLCMVDDANEPPDHVVSTCLQCTFQVICSS